MRSIEHLKVGDKVQISPGGYRALHRTGRIIGETKTEFRVMVNGLTRVDRVRKDNGLVIGTGNGWHSQYVQEYDKKFMAEQELRRRHLNLAAKLNAVNWNDLPYETLRVIYNTVKK